MAGMPYDSLLSPEGLDVWLIRSEVFSCAGYPEMGLCERIEKQGC